MRAEVVSITGEGKDRSEDFYFIDFDQQRKRLKVAVGDWAHNVVGGPYVDSRFAILRGDPQDTQYNGGVIGATVAKEVITSTEETGLALLALLNEELRDVYKRLEVRNYLEQREHSFTGYIAHAIVTPEKMVVTAVGDVSLAADQLVLAGQVKRIDIENALRRRRYIEETGDVEGSWQAISRLGILNQYRYQNTPGHDYSYPAIDGTETLPREKVCVLVRETPQSLLLWTDGYVTPDEFSIEGLEQKLKNVYREDPYRYQKYPAVGHSRDDRTAINVVVDDWKSLTVNTRNEDESYRR